METAAQVSTNPTEKTPVAATGSAKDAANNSAAAKSHGATVPPHDSVAYSAARDYGAQHGFAAWEVDQVAALLSYYGCEKQQDCANLLADGGLPFHITSIMQAMGDPRADGTFDIGHALRSLQEAQMMMIGDPNVSNSTGDGGRVTRFGGAGMRHGEGNGGGTEDYFTDTSLASLDFNVMSYDFSDESYDAYNGYSASDNIPPPNLDPLPSLLPVDSNGPIMLPPPDVRLDHELAPIPTIGVAEQANPQTLINDVPDAQAESAANARAISDTLAANPPLTLNPENGQYGRDYGNGVWSYPLETPQIESHNLLATNNDTISADTGLIDHLSGIYQAYQRGDISLSDALSMATGSVGYSARATNAEYSVTTRLGGAAQAAGGFVEALVGLGLSDTVIGAVIGVPIAAHGIDNMFAGERTMVEGNHVPTMTVEALEYAGMSPMAAELANAGIGLVGTVGPGAVRAVAVGRAAEAEEVAALSLERAVELERSENLGATRLPADATTAEVNANRINTEANGVRTVEAREPVDLNDFDRLNQIDMDVNRLRPGEAGAATELENYLGETLERVTNPDIKGDFVITTGEDAGKTVDFMLTPGSALEADKINEFFVKNSSGFMEDLIKHVDKYDIVCLDTRFLTQENQSILIDMIDRLTPEQRAQIILIK